MLHFTDLKLNIVPSKRFVNHDIRMVKNNRITSKGFVYKTFEKKMEEKQETQDRKKEEGL